MKDKIREALAEFVEELLYCCFPYFACMFVLSRYQDDFSAGQYETLIHCFGVLMLGSLMRWSWHSACIKQLQKRVDKLENACCAIYGLVTDQK